MVVDCFTFCSEFELLKIRLEEYADLCDKIILVEGNKHQNGSDKPFFFDERKEEFVKWLPKIIHIKVDDFPEFDRARPFLLDKYQRDQIVRGLRQIDIDENTYTILADCDEILRREKLQDFLKNPQDFAVFQLDYRVYFFNLRCIDKIWNGPTVFRGVIVLKHSCHDLLKNRDMFDNPMNWDYPNLIKNAGNHLGYQTDVEEIYAKLQYAAEPFDKINGIPPFNFYQELYNQKARRDGSFIFSDQPMRDDLKFEVIDSLEDLPREIRNNPEKYQHRFWKEEIKHLSICKLSDEQLAKLDCS